MGIPLFISYSHQDQQKWGWLDHVCDQLAPLENDGLIEVWDDREIRAGHSESWEAQLLPKLEKAGVIILLLSPAFARSDYCQRVELAHAIERKERGAAQVYFIHLRTYSIEVSLRRFQILPSDKMSVADTEKPDKALRDIVDAIREDLSGFRPSVTRPASNAGSVRALPGCLPYLCNRTEQEDTLHFLCEGKPGQSQRPMVFVVGGPDRECHEAFHERISKEFLPGLMGFSGLHSIDPSPVEWPGSADERIFAVRIARALDLKGSDPRTVLQNLPEGLTFVTTAISGDDWNAGQQEALRTYLKFWNSCPDLPARRAVCAGISVAWNKSGPSDKELGRLFPTADYGALRFAVVPDLKSLVKRHALDWLNHRKVKPWYDRDTSRDALRSGIEDVFGARPAIPMRDLAGPLLSLLEKCA